MPVHDSPEAAPPIMTETRFEASTSLEMAEAQHSVCRLVAGASVCVVRGTHRCFGTTVLMWITTGRNLPLHLRKRVFSFFELTATNFLTQDNFRECWTLLTFSSS